MAKRGIRFPRGKIERFCRRHGIRRLSLFGSVLQGKARPGSDVDLLVEFEPRRRVGFVDMAEMEEELSSLLGNRRVDLRTPAELSRYFRDSVVAEAVVAYAGP